MDEANNILIDTNIDKNFMSNNSKNSARYTMRN